MQETTLILCAPFVESIVLRMETTTAIVPLAVAIICMTQRQIVGSAPSNRKISVNLTVLQTRFVLVAPAPRILDCMELTAKAAMRATLTTVLTPRDSHPIAHVIARICGQAHNAMFAIRNVTLLLAIFPVLQHNVFAIACKGGVVVIVTFVCMQRELLVAHLAIL